MFQNRHPGTSSHNNNNNNSNSQHQMKLGVNDYLDRVRDEFNTIHGQLQNARLELEKCNQEKEMIQRHYAMYYEIACNINVEAHKQSEIVKRLSGILGHIIPLLPPEHQASAIQAVERAKSINQQELQAIVSTQMHQQQMAAASMLPGMGALGGSAASAANAMAAAMGGNPSAAAAAAAAAFHPMMAAAAAGIKQEDAMNASALFNNLFKSGQLPPGMNMLPGLVSGIPTTSSTGVAPMGGGNGAAAAVLPGTSSASVPPLSAGMEEAAVRLAAGNAVRAASSTRPRSSAGSPSVGGRRDGGNRAPSSSSASSLCMIPKRPKVEVDDADGEVEIDVQNDDSVATTSTGCSGHPPHTNGMNNNSGHRSGSRNTNNGTLKDGGRESTQSAASSRDSATPRNNKQLSSTPTLNNNLFLPGVSPDLNVLIGAQNARLLDNMNMNSRMFGNFNAQMAAMMAAQTNGKPTYAYRVSASSGGQPQPVEFPDDAATGADVPKTLKRIGELNHEQVVCAVTISSTNRYVYTGGQGCVKMWDIGEVGSSVDAADESKISDAVSSSTSSPSSATTAAVSSMTNFSCGAVLECLGKSYVRSCKLYSDDSTLVVGGESNMLCIWDLKTERNKSTLNCAAEACYAIVLSPDDRMCFSCCADGNIVIWDLVSEKQVASMQGHQDGASCVDLAANGINLWTGGLDSTVRTWDIRERKEVNKYELDSQIFCLGCCPTDDYVAAGMENNQVVVLNTSSHGADERYVLHDHETSVLALRFAHSGRWFVSTAKDSALNAWRTPYGYRLIKNREASSVLSCDISRNDRVIVTGSGDNKASVYRVSY